MLSKLWKAIVFVIEIIVGVYVIRFILRLAEGQPDAVRYSLVIISVLAGFVCIKLTNKFLNSLGGVSKKVKEKVKKEVTKEDTGLLGSFYQVWKQKD